MVEKSRVEEKKGYYEPIEEYLNTAIKLRREVGESDLINSMIEDIEYYLREAKDKGPLNSLHGGSDNDSSSDESEYSVDEYESEEEYDYYGGSQEMDLLDLYGGGFNEAVRAFNEAWTITGDYRNQFGEIPMHHDLNWANRQFSHFLLFGEESIPEFKKTYMPLITSDPLASISVLFQLYEDPSNLAKSLIDLETLLKFKKSRYYLSDDPEMVKLGTESLLEYMSPKYIQEYPVETMYFMAPQWDNESSYIKGLFGNAGDGLDAFMGSSSSSSGKKISNEIVGLYKKMYGEPNRFAPGTVDVFKRTFRSKIPEQELKHDFMRYVIKLIYDKPTHQFDNIMSGIFSRDTTSFMDVFGSLSDGPLMNFANQGPWAFNSSLMLEMGLPSPESIPGMSMLNIGSGGPLSMSGLDFGSMSGTSQFGKKTLSRDMVAELF